MSQHVAVRSLSRALRVALLITAIASLAPAGGARAQTPVASPGAAYPVTIQSCGQAVTFDRPPERVVVTFPTMVDTLVDLGLGDRIVGIGQTDGGSLRPADVAILGDLDLRVDGVIGREAMVATQPDLVFADGAYTFDATAGAASVEELAAIGAGTYTAVGGCPDEHPIALVDDLAADLTTLGLIFGVPERAQALIAELTASVADVTAHVAPLDRPKTAWIGLYGDPYAYAGGIYGDLITLAGGTNAFADVGETYQAVSSETILARDPEVILVSYGQAADIDANVAAMRQLFPGVTAVVTDRLLPVEEGASCHGSTRQADLLMAIAMVIHPDAFPASTTPVA